VYPWHGNSTATILTFINVLQHVYLIGGCLHVDESISTNEAGKNSPTTSATTMSSWESGAGMDLGPSAWGLLRGAKHLD